jgi:hypothetical protein
MVFWTTVDRVAPPTDTCTVIDCKEGAPDTADGAEYVTVTSGTAGADLDDAVATFVTQGPREPSKVEHTHLPHQLWLAASCGRP